MIIDGKKIAKDEYELLKEEIKSMQEKPSLHALLVWNNPSSLRYIRQKKKWADYIWIDFFLYHFEEDWEEKVLLEKIESLNNNKKVSGIICQLPLPEKIDTKKVIDSIHPLKDVDGFTNINMGKIVIGDDSWLVPCTPAGVMHIFEKEKIDLKGKKVVIIGRSNIVGKPLVNICINKQATVSCCNSKTKDIKEYTKDADIVILATGKPWLLSLDMINDATIVIDVWFTVEDGKIYGDACFEEIEKNGNKITPVPGWVGALTVLFLMKNTLKAFYLQK